MALRRADRIDAGRPSEAQLLLSLEDERLAGMTVADLGYLEDAFLVRTAEGFEVDLLAHRPWEDPLLIQVCLESEGDETWERELRGLAAAFASHPAERPFLITLDAMLGR